MAEINDLPVNMEISDRAYIIEQECREYVHKRTNGGDQTLHVYTFLFDKIAELQIALEKGVKK